MRTVYVGNGQNAMDIATQKYGCAEGLLQIVADNPDVMTSIDAVPLPGTPLKIQDVVPQFNSLNVSLAANMATLGTKVASGLIPVIVITNEDGNQIESEDDFYIQPDTN